MQLKKLMIEVMIFFVLAAFFAHVERQKIRLEKQQRMRTKRLRSVETIIPHLTIPMRMAIWQELM